METSSVVCFSSDYCLLCSRTSSLTTIFFLLVGLLPTFLSSAPLLGTPPTQSSLATTANQTALGTTVASRREGVVFPRYEEPRFQTITDYFDNLDQRLVAEYPELNDFPTSIRELDEVPKYLLTLLNRDYLPAALGNTIRGIQSKAGTIEASAAFLFTASPLRPTESLMLVELHLFWKRMLVRAHRPRTRVALHLVDKRGRFLATRRDLWLDPEQPGWLALNITRTLVAFFRRSSEDPVQFAITFEVVRSDGRIQEVSLNKFMGRDGLGRPFLVLFIKDSQGRAANLRAVTTSVVKPSSGRQHRSQKRRREEHGNVMLDVAHIPRLSDAEGRRRRKRNIVAIKDGVEYIYIPLVVPGKNGNSSNQKAEKKSRHRKKKQQRKLKTDSAKKSEMWRRLQTNEQKTRQMQTTRRKKKQLTKETKRSRRRRRRRRRRRKEEERKHLRHWQKRQRQRKIRLENQQLEFGKTEKKKGKKDTVKRLHKPESNWWTYLNVNDTKKGERSKDWGVPFPTPSESLKTRRGEVEGNRGGLCRRVPLRVDFGDLGWDRWVISPKYYRSHMCVGSCQFSPSDKMYSHLSNHAFIQNMLHTIKLDEPVAPPCCVPTKTSSETLLYYDDNRNVILKTFPDMRVDECGCR